MKYSPFFSPEVCLRLFRIKRILCCILVTFVIGCLISLSSLTPDECHCNGEPSKQQYHLNNKGHKLGIVVPFRDRFEELLEFVPHLHNFLNAQNLNHAIYVINQVDQYRFNRASLINVGFTMAVTEGGCDYIAMHDVDLLPMNPLLSYAYPHNGLFHVASPQLHPRYHYSTFVGGILLVKREDFEKVNGMSNKYWGWGLEDDEFFVRLKEAGLNISRPGNLTSGIEGTFRHMHDRVWRKRDMAKCYNQREVTRRRDRMTGLNDVKYIIQSKYKLTINTASVDVINVALKCNRTMTPWCLCSEENKSSTGYSKNSKDKLKQKNSKSVR
ncbi:beta-1,4-galactosyltransferase 7 [Nilaparvata lugens]|uniref:beta-1,4-galactosyltransferase 7 n=1 Tax=Nilaparvata lugens TaxID=108931 RepID=UPI00193C9134|nr:beta-1,4-galactosyltransferase 7 [Nilaparvata lugens]